MSSVPKIRIAEEGGKLSVYTPYNPEFVELAKAKGARWNPTKKSWDFNIDSRTAAEEALEEVFGTLGQPDEKLVDIEVRLTGPDYGDAETLGPFRVGGIAVASARSRDGGAHVKDGVLVVSGGFESGGSKKNWATCVMRNTVIRMFGVPEGAAKLIEEEYETRILEPGSEEKAKRLQAEKERLLARIAEIDALLAESSSEASAA